MYNYLTNIFPSPESTYFTSFKNGIIDTSIYLGYGYLGLKILSGFQKLYKDGCK